MTLLHASKPPSIFFTVPVTPLLFKTLTASCESIPRRHNVYTKTLSVPHGPYQYAVLSLPGVFSSISFFISSMRSFNLLSGMSDKGWLVSLTENNRHVLIDPSKEQILNCTGSLTSNNTCLSRLSFNFL